MKNWLLQHPEGPRGNDWDIGDEMDTAQETVATFLDTLLDFFFEDLIQGGYEELISLLSANVLGVNPALIIIVLSLAMTTKYLVTGRFL